MSSSPKYKLTYLPIRGRAEILRLIFAYLKIPYEDERIQMVEFEKAKNDAPFGTLPYVEFLETGKKYSSSISLARWFAEEHGMAGSSTLENLELFSIIDATADAWFKIYAAIYHEKNPDRKAALLKNLHEEYLPKHITKFECMAAANKSEKGWIFGNKFTYADIATFLLFEYVAENIPGSDEKYPTLAKQRKSILQLKDIAKWIETRPVTRL